MVIAIIPALIPDIPAVYDAYFAAFKADKMGEIMLNILFPNGIDDEFRKGHAAATLDWWHKSDFQYTFKVVDLDSGEIMGMALADFYFRPRTAEERAPPTVPWLEGEYRERAERILRPLAAMREKLLGEHRHICRLIFKNKSNLILHISCVNFKFPSYYY
jgi:hypothetical protein